MNCADMSQRRVFPSFLSILWIGDEVHKFQNMSSILFHLVADVPKAYVRRLRSS